jgi:hypothetical protein
MFRFTVRDLLLVMVCVALSAGWWMDRRQLMSQNRYLTYEHREMQGRYDSMRASNRELADTVRAFQAAMSVQAPGPTPSSP